MSYQPYVAIVCPSRRYAEAEIEGYMRDHEGLSPRDRRILYISDHYDCERVNGLRDISWAVCGPTSAVPRVLDEMHARLGPPMLLRDALHTVAWTEGTRRWEERGRR